ncbi:MAG: DUF1080 domain-containing protein [Gemmatimonadetes bacterium]|nr:DUF1080 domain-containing protein [Gemmatimonadota bacterium]
MKNRLTRSATTVAAIVALACAGPGSSDQANAQEGKAMPADSQWRPLFDGETTAGWRGYRAEGMPDGWAAVDGNLTRVASAGDIITEEEFGNFELALEWQISPSGNSGIFFRVTEDADRTYESGPEMQVLDDATHADGGNLLTAAGANYGLYPVPEYSTKPAGEWNEVRILVEGAHVEHWLNGVMVVEYELWSPDWEQKVANSKFSEWPGYGRAKRGHIGLQDHGDWVAYRNIRIREIP